ncbi:MAG: hypothetical protein OQK35_08460, partial [Alphaproteobacteria bacterium]|nr:hypothetical protein [Alphaproteobacteria bacterium]
PISKSEILSFYKTVLPQLGWMEKTQGVFQREGEILKLEFPTEIPDKSNQDKTVTVHFALSPYK